MGRLRFALLAASMLLCWNMMAQHGGTAEQGHVDIGVTTSNVSAENPAYGLCGVRWDVTNSMYKVIGVVCLPPPPVTEESNITVTTVLNPGGLLLTQANVNLGHAGDFMCIRFERGENANGIFDLAFKIEVDNTQFEETYYVKIYVYGGPLQVVMEQEAAEGVIYTLHMDETGQPDSVYPRYCTDFAYNPFLYRSVREFKPDSLTQKVNVCKAKPLWFQPGDIKVLWSRIAWGFPEREL